MTRLSLLSISAVVLTGCAVPPMDLDDKGNPLSSSAVDNVRSISFSASQPAPDNAFDAVGTIRGVSWWSWTNGNIRIKDGELWFEVTPTQTPKQQPIYGKLNDLRIKSSNGRTVAEVGSAQILAPEIRIAACPRESIEFSKQRCLLALSSQSLVAHTPWMSRHFNGGDRVKLDRGDATDFLGYLASPPDVKSKTTRVVRAVDEKWAAQVVQDWQREQVAEKAAREKRAGEEALIQQRRVEEQFGLYLKSSKKGSQLFCGTSSPIAAGAPIVGATLECADFAGLRVKGAEIVKAGWAVQGETRTEVPTYNQGVYVRASVTFMKR